MADVNGIAKVQLFNQLVYVSSVCVHFVAGNGLCGASMSAAVMSDHAVSPLEKEHHLSVPVVCRERPAMVEEQRLAIAPVLVINLGAVFRRDRCHGMTSLICWKSVGQHYARIERNFAKVSKLGGLTHAPVDVKSGNRVRREKAVVHSGGVYRPGIGSLHPGAIRAAGRNVSERRAGPETDNAGADPPRFEGRPKLVERYERTSSIRPARVLATACK